MTIEYLKYNADLKFKVDYKTALFIGLYLVGSQYIGKIDIFHLLIHFFPNPNNIHLNQ